MYNLLLNVMDADEQARVPTEVMLGFMEWIANNYTSIRNQVVEGNINLG